MNSPSSMRTSLPTRSTPIPRSAVAGGLSLTLPSTMLPRYLPPISNLPPLSSSSWPMEDQDTLSMVSRPWSSFRSSTLTSSSTRESNSNRMPTWWKRYVLSSRAQLARLAHRKSWRSTSWTMYSRMSFSSKVLNNEPWSQSTIILNIFINYNTYSWY